MRMLIVILILSIPLTSVAELPDLNDDPRVETVKQFEESLTQEEIIDVTASNISSKFRLLNKLGIFSETIRSLCTLDRYKVLASAEKPELLVQRITPIIFLNDGDDDEFITTYIEKLISLARAKGLTSVAEFYEKFPREPTAESKVKRDLGRKKLRDQLQATGLSGDNVDSYRLRLRSASPECAAIVNFQVLDFARQDVTQSRGKILRAAIQEFYSDKPTRVFDLTSISADFLKTRDAFLEDGWNIRFILQGTRELPVIRSVGPDGRENTLDDIVVEKKG